MSDAIQSARERYLDATEGVGNQRQQIAEDLEFSDPSDPKQWPADEKAQRENDPGGRRPCLVHDQTGQYVANVAGQVEQRPPAAHAIPVGDGADRKVAEHLDGYFRHIEYSSRAPQHYTRSLTSAGRAGVGYLFVRPEYVDRALNWQEPRISSEGDPLRVVLDPWSVELDGSDAKWGIHLVPMSHSDFEMQFGAKAEKVSFGEDATSSVKDDRKSIVVADEWLIEETRKNVIIARVDGTEDQFSMSEDEYHAARQRDPRIVYVDNFMDKVRCVKWRRMSGAQVFSTTDYPADSIGIVPMYGYVGWSDGRMKYCGIPRRARAAQQAYNYHISELRAYMNQAPKAPWLVPISAIQDQKVKDLWDRASVESRAWLPYNDWDAAERRTVPPPSRAQISTNLQNHMAGAEQALKDIQASLGMYQASLGAPSNETSGVAIEGRKQQGEAATAHFPAHMAASIAQVGRLCMQMIPRLIDTKRQLRVLGIDNTPGKVMVDPKQAEPLRDDGGTISINPNIGRYDVRVVVGASFSTQRQQAQEAYTEMMRANPEMMPALAPLWAQTLDVPHADKLAQVLTAMAPEPVKAILQPEQQEDTAQLKAQNEQLKKALQEAIQHAHDAQNEADEANLKLQTAANDHEDKGTELAIKAFDAETKRLQVLGTTLDPAGVQLLVRQTIENMLRSPDPMAGEEQHEAMDAQMPSPGDPMAQEPMEPPEAAAQEQAEPAEIGASPIPQPGPEGPTDFTTQE